MAVTIRKTRGGQNIFTNAEINIGQNGGGLNFYADDGTLLMQGDKNGLTIQDADGTKRSRLGTQPDGSRDSFFGITADGEELE